MRRALHILIVLLIVGVVSIIITAQWRGIDIYFGRAGIDIGPNSVRMIWSSPTVSHLTGEIMNPSGWGIWVYNTTRLRNGYFAFPRYYSFRGLGVSWVELPW